MRGWYVCVKKGGFFLNKLATFSPLTWQPQFITRWVEKLQPGTRSYQAVRFLVNNFLGPDNGFEVGWEEILIFCRLARVFPLWGVVPTHCLL